MFVEILRPEWTLPDGSNTVYMDFKIIPMPDAAGRMLGGNSKWGGRFEVKGGSVTNLMTQTAPTPHFGTANVGMEVGAGLNLTNTTPQYGSGTPIYPFNRIRLSGSISGGDTRARLVLMCDFPVDDIIVLFARGGMPVKEGDSLLNVAKLGNTVVR